MQHRTWLRLFGCLLAAILVLGGLSGTGERHALAAEETDTRPVLRVSSVDGLLRALGSGVIIELEAGEYDLSTASDYGTEKGADSPYTWSEVYDGFELVIRDLSNLEISGVGAGDVRVLALPAYANVIAISNCSAVRLSGLTLGHKGEPGTCSGDVLLIEDCIECTVDNCVLFGCGVHGVNAVSCTGLTVQDSTIYGCSDGAVTAQGTYDFRMVNCDVYENGLSLEWYGSVLSCYGGDGFAAVNCRFHDDRCQALLTSMYTEEVSLLGCTFTNERNESGAINAIGYAPVIEGCSFDIAGEFYGFDETGEQVPAQTVDGQSLTQGDLEKMEHRVMEYTGPVGLSFGDIDYSMYEGGVYYAETVDDFLNLLAPDRVILLKEGTYDLSKAADYGVEQHGWYTWEMQYDGPGLILQYLYGVTIRGLGDVQICASPRYASVLSFRNCSDITLDNVKLGHFEAPGTCTGAVISLNDCYSFRVFNSYLYGCGYTGIDAASSRQIYVSDSEIAHCSGSAVWLYDVDTFCLQSCNVHDCGEPVFWSDDSCRNIFFGDIETIMGVG